MPRSSTITALWGAVLLLAGLPAASAQEHPASLLRPAPAEALALFQASQQDPRVLLPYLDLEHVRKTLRAPADRTDQRALGLYLRQWAVERLGDIGGEEMAAALLRYAGERTAAGEADAATAAQLATERIRLRGLGREAYVRAMIAWVRQASPPDSAGEQPAKDSWRRVMSGARALGVLQAREGVSAILARRAASPWDTTYLGIFLVRALARIGDPAAMPTMEKLLGRYAGYSPSASLPLEPDEPDVAAAYWRLRTQGMTVEAAVTEMLRAASDDPGPWPDVGLASLGPVAVPALIRGLASPPGSKSPGRAQHAAAMVLGYLGAAEAVDPLGQVLRSGLPTARPTAATALGRIGGPAAVPYLLEAANDPAVDVRHCVVGALGLIGDTCAEPLLLRLALDSPDHALRYRALYALRRAGTSVSVPALQARRAIETDASLRTEIDVTMRELSRK